jgi:dUTPase
MKVDGDTVITTGREDKYVITTNISAGERVAQLVLRKSYRFEWEDITGTPFDNASRGGFGSTGRA